MDAVLGALLLSAVGMAGFQLVRMAAQGQLGRALVLWAGMIVGLLGVFYLASLLR